MPRYGLRTRNANAHVTVEETAALLQETLGANGALPEPPEPGPLVIEETMPVMGEGEGVAPAPSPSDNAEREELLDAPSPIARTQPVEVDPFAEMKSEIHLTVIADLGVQLFNTTIDNLSLRARVLGEVRRHLAEKNNLSHVERDQIASELAADILGYGPLEPLLADDTITEIMVNGPFDVRIERQGKLSRTSASFRDESHLRRILNKIVAEVGRRVDESSPMVDARLPDGSRINAIIPPLSLHGALVTIRKFSRRRLTFQDMISLGTLTAETNEFLALCIKARLNILVSGGTGSGKTTLLNVISSAIPDSERVVTIEDSAELNFDQDHTLSLESRPPNIEGHGAIAIRDLLRNSLRMRPDRIIIGEVRGGEALDMLQAMNTGHDGSLTTVHANSPRDALSRIETMVMMAGFELPLQAIRQQISSALDLIVHIERMTDGSRKVTAITEVQRMEAQVITLQDLFAYRHVRITDEQAGALVPTGLRPTFQDKFEKNGVMLPIGLFNEHASSPPRDLSRQRGG
jgi:pilus assembly protein CpaF